MNYLQPVLYYLLPQFINTVETAKIAFLLVHFCSHVHVSGLKRAFETCLCLVFNHLVQVAGAKTN